MNKKIFINFPPENPRVWVGCNLYKDGDNHEE